MPSGHSEGIGTDKTVFDRAPCNLFGFEDPDGEESRWPGRLRTCLHDDICLPCLVHGNTVTGSRVFRIHESGGLWAFPSDLVGREVQGQFQEAAHVLLVGLKSYGGWRPPFTFHLFTFHLSPSPHCSCQPQECGCENTTPLCQGAGGTGKS